MARYRGGVGSNQYQTRGSSRAANVVPAGSTLLAQARSPRLSSADIRSGFARAPFDPTDKAQQARRQQAVNDLMQEVQQAHPDVQLWLSARQSGHVVLDRIQVPPEQRGQGVGTKIVQQICDEADRHSWALALTPDTERGHKARSQRFFNRFGFAANKGRHIDFTASESMIREPDPARYDPDNSEMAL